MPDVGKRITNGGRVTNGGQGTREIAGRTVTIKLSIIIDILLEIFRQVGRIKTQFSSLVFILEFYCERATRLLKVRKSSAIYTGNR